MYSHKIKWKEEILVNHLFQDHNFKSNKCEDSLIGWCAPVESQLDSPLGLYEEEIMRMCVMIMMRKIARNNLLIMLRKISREDLLIWMSMSAPVEMK